MRLRFVDVTEKGSEPIGSDLSLGAVRDANSIALLELIDSST